MTLGGARLGSFVALALACAALVPDPVRGAPARPGIPASLNEQRASAHFVVHFTTSDPAHAVAADAIPGVLAIAERAYSAEVNERSAFGPPLDDGDGRVDIYVFDLPKDVAITRGDRPTPDRPNQASAYIELDREAATEQGARGALHYVLPHELFHVLQFAYSGREALWLAEATAEWAARSLAGVDFYAQPEENWFQNPHEPLDCFESACTSTPTDERATQGYDRWHFFRYLEERFGPRIVYEIWTHSRALSSDGEPHALEAIDGALRARGESLSALYADFVAFVPTQAWQLEGLRRRTPARVADFRTGTRAVDNRSMSLRLFHLAAAYVGLQGGGGRAETLSLCLPTRLWLGVVQGGGQAEPPAFVAADAAPVPLLGAGAERAVEVRWQTCQAATATLAFANTTWNVDDVAFALTTRVGRVRPLRLSRSAPDVTFYLELAVPRRVRVEIALPRVRGTRGRRTVVRRRSVGAGVRPVRVRLPRRATGGRYRLTVRFRDRSRAVRELGRSFSVRLK